VSAASVDPLRKGTTLAVPSTYLFVGLDYGGTWKPMLGLARKLLDRGHRVEVLGAPFMRERAEAGGCVFRSLPATFDDPDGWAVEDDWSIYDRRISGIEIAEATTAALVESEADVAVFDCLLVGALSAAERSSVPAVVIVHMLAYEMLEQEPHGFDDWVELVNETRAVLGLDALAPVTGLPDLWSRSAAVLSLPPPAWTAGRMPAEVIPVGPIANEQRVDTAPAPDGERPRIVISLSSSYMHQESLLQRLAEAASGLPGSVIVSLAGAIARDAVRMPDTVEVVDWLNFETVLPYTDLLVTHGGQATVSAGMRHGVPMIISPLGRDQDRVGRHIEAEGIGLVLEEGADVETIRLTMGRVLGDRGFLAASQRAAAALEALDDGAIAVKILEELAALRR